MAPVVFVSGDPFCNLFDYKTDIFLWIDPQPIFSRLRLKRVGVEEKFDNADALKTLMKT